MPGCSRLTLQRTQARSKQARVATPVGPSPAVPPSEAALVQACQALQARNRLLEHTARVAFEHGQQVSCTEVSSCCEGVAGLIAAPAASPWHGEPSVVQPPEASWLSW